MKSDTFCGRVLKAGKLGPSAEEMGRHLLTKFKGISGIDCAHFEKLLAVPGMGISKTAQLKAAIEIGKRARMQNAQLKGFNNAADAAVLSDRGLKASARNPF